MAWQPATSIITIACVLAGTAALASALPMPAQVPCVKLNTTDLGNDGCKSYVCTAVMFVNGALDGGCSLKLTPGGTALFVQVISTPPLMPDGWRLHAAAWNFDSQAMKDCNTWSGNGGLLPLTLECTHGPENVPGPMVGTGKWQTFVFYELLPTPDLTNPQSYTLGTVQMYFGPSPMF